VRTVAGREVHESQVLPPAAPGVSGVLLADGRTLPIAWAVRESQPMIKRVRADGSVAWVADPEAPPIARHALVEGWSGRRTEGDWVVHVLRAPGTPESDERYLKDWFVAVAEVHPRPREVAADEPWVHVDTSQQTLVLYRGDTPLFATLVSTGVEGHETPIGVFTVRSKFIADTMSNIGMDAADDRYRIEDVPWTQYFEGSVALHGAFWHERFGLTRSHGCVNMAPADAHYVWNEMWPAVPEGWLGISAADRDVRASHVVITE
jgi:hypothetical protein